MHQYSSVKGTLPQQYMLVELRGRELAKVPSLINSLMLAAGLLSVRFTRAPKMPLESAQALPILGNVHRATT
jgi:hypothetical protein